VAQKIGLQRDVVQRAKSKVKDKNLSLDLLLGKLQKEKTELSKTQQRIQEKEKQTEVAKAKYNELFEKYKELLEKRKLSRDEDNKLMELGRRLRVLMHEYEHSKDKKAVIQKFAKTAKDEGLKKQESKKKKDEFTETESQRKKRLAGIQIGAKVRVIKGKQVGIVEDITKTKARVIFGAVKSTIDINQLEAAEDK
jgi:DNA mismatch repair protein MutS2